MIGSSTTICFSAFIRSCSSAAYRSRKVTVAIMWYELHEAGHSIRSLGTTLVKFESLDPEIRGVLGKKVSELGLKLEGSPVEGYVRELYKELERRGFRKF